MTDGNALCCDLNKIFLQLFLLLLPDENLSVVYSSKLSLLPLLLTPFVLHAITQMQIRDKFFWKLINSTKYSNFVVFMVFRVINCSLGLDYLPVFCQFRIWPLTSSINPQSLTPSLRLTLEFNTSNTQRQTLIEGNLSYCWYWLLDSFFLLIIVVLTVQYCVLWWHHLWWLSQPDEGMHWDDLLLQHKYRSCQS